MRTGTRLIDGEIVEHEVVEVDLRCPDCNMTTMVCAALEDLVLIHRGKGRYLHPTATCENFAEIVAISEPEGPLPEVPEDQAGYKAYVATGGWT